MVKTHVDDPDRTAAIVEGISHSFRIAILNELRADRKLSFGDLRRRVAQNYEELNFRTLLHHLFKMQMAGLVEIGKEDGEGVVTLLQDIRFASKRLARPAKPGQRTNKEGSASRLRQVRE